MFLTWLPDVLRDADLQVDVLPGWSQRGSRGRGIDPVGIVCHHTVTGRSWPDHRVDHLLRDGHSTLAGPLSQLGLRRDGSFVVVAAGLCNHNGYGQWKNQAIGIEAYNDGKGEPWPEVQMDAYARGCAALLRHLGLGVDRCKGHKETDPGRKTDPTFDMAAFRRRVASHLNEPPQEDDMPAVLAALRTKAGSNAEHHHYVIQGRVASFCHDEDEIAAAHFLGAAWWGGKREKAYLDPVIWRSLAIMNGPLANLRATA